MTRALNSKLKTLPNPQKNISKLINGPTPDRLVFYIVSGVQVDRKPRSGVREFDFGPLLTEADSPIVDIVPTEILNRKLLYCSW